MIFADYINAQMSDNNFIRFDSFIIQKMGYEYRDDDLIRRQVFLKFRKMTQRKAFASLPTMRRWFGIQGYRKPSRESVYEICFALGLSRNETEEYLTKGLGQPSFQINDYQEIIFLYGLENNKSYEDCIKIIERFEDCLDEDFTTSKTSNTRELIGQYEANKNLNADDFLVWMLDRASWFKGYSQTAFNYMLAYKKGVMDGIRKEEKRRMLDMLSEAGYERWLAGHRRRLNPDSKETIRKFVKNYHKSEKYNVSENLGKIIWELAKDVYSEKDTNVRLISEVFGEANVYSKNSINYSYGFIRPGSEKYFSDLFRIPVHKENIIKISKAVCELKKMESGEECPKWIADFIYSIFLNNDKIHTVEEAKSVLDRYSKDYKRRCLTIQREDLLPLIHTVAQQHYLSENSDEYHKDIAIEIFINYANTTLNACNMPPLSNEYEIDTVLMACYTDKEMYSYADVLSIFDKNRGDCLKT